jgi:hypothetical protein
VATSAVSTNHNTIVSVVTVRVAPPVSPACTRSSQPTAPAVVMSASSTRTRAPPGITANTPHTAPAASSACTSIQAASGPLRPSSVISAGTPSSAITSTVSAATIQKRRSSTPKAPNTMPVVLWRLSAPTSTWKWSVSQGAGLNRWNSTELSLPGLTGWPRASGSCARVAKACALRPVCRPCSAAAQPAAAMAPAEVPPTFLKRQVCASLASIFG